MALVRETLYSIDSRKISSDIMVIRLSVVRFEDMDIMVDIRLGFTANGILLTTDEFKEYLPVIEYVYCNVGRGISPVIELEKDGRKFYCKVAPYFNMEVGAKRHGFDKFSGMEDWLEKVFILAPCVSSYLESIGY